MSGGIGLNPLAPLGGFLLETAVRATLLLAVGLLLARLCGTRRASWRSFLLNLCIVGLIGMPLSFAFLPVIHLPEAPGFPLLDPAAPAPAFWGTGSLSQTDGVAPALPEDGGAFLQAEALRSGAVVLFMIYGLGLAVLLARLGRGLVAVRALRRSLDRVEDPALFNRLRQWRLRLGIRKQVRLACSDRVKSPTQIGTLNPVVVLPRQMPDDAAALDRVLVHELMHVRRYDCLFRLISHIALALYWPHPLAWAAARRLCEAQEQACDDWAATATGDANGYADTLLAMTARMQPVAGLALGMDMARTPQVMARAIRLSALEGRLLPDVGRPAGMVAGLALAAFVAALSSLHPAVPDRRPVPAHSVVAPLSEPTALREAKFPPDPAETIPAVEESGPESLAMSALLLKLGDLEFPVSVRRQVEDLQPALEPQAVREVVPRTFEEIESGPRPDAADVALHMVRLFRGQIAGTAAIPAGKPALLVSRTLRPGDGSRMALDEEGSVRGFVLLSTDMWGRTRARRIEGSSSGYRRAQFSGDPEALTW